MVASTGSWARSACDGFFLFESAQDLLFPAGSPIEGSNQQEHHPIEGHDASASSIPIDFRHPGGHLERNLKTEMVHTGARERQWDMLFPCFVAAGSTEVSCTLRALSSSTSLGTAYHTACPVVAAKTRTRSHLIICSSTVSSGKPRSYHVHVSMSSTRRLGGFDEHSTSKLACGDLETLRVLSM